MKFDFKSYLIFFILINLLNIFGWYIRHDRLDNFIYPLTIKDALGMIFWSSLFKILLFLNSRKLNFKFVYFAIIYTLPRLLLYISICSGDFFLEDEILDILNSSNGMQTIWIEQLYKNGSNFIIDRYVLYYFAILLETIIVYLISLKISNNIFKKK